jgi:hypothetical protein
MYGGPDVVGGMCITITLARTHTHTHTGFDLGAFAKLVSEDVLLLECVLFLQDFDLDAFDAFCVLVANTDYDAVSQGSREHILVREHIIVREHILVRCLLCPRRQHPMRRGERENTF